MGHVIFHSIAGEVLTVGQLDHDEVLCASAMSTEWYVGFGFLCRETGLCRDRVAHAVRGLALKGYARYGRGLWSDDLRPSGAGYQLLETREPRHG